MIKRSDCQLPLMVAIVCGATSVLSFLGAAVVSTSPEQLIKLFITLGVVLGLLALLGFSMLVVISLYLALMGEKKEGEEKDSSVK